MTDMPTPSQQKAAETSLGDLVGEVSRDLSELMRKELELAKAELSESAKRAGKGAGLMGGAGYAGGLAVLFLSIAVWWGLGDLIDSLGWSAVIVAVIWAIVAAILFAVGRSRLKDVQGAPKTVETVKEIPEALKRNQENR